jgi:DNA-binding MarR family transcriptional regulator
MFMELDDDQFKRLLAFRSGIRQFLRWSEERAADVGLTAAQHQLLLAVRGDPDPRGPTIGDIAYHLLVRHHSAVGLVDRAETLGLVRRRLDPEDQRVVRIELTAAGERRLRALTEQHMAELERIRIAPRIQALWADIELVGTERRSATSGRPT